MMCGRFCRSSIEYEGRLDLSGVIEEVEGSQFRTTSWQTFTSLCCGYLMGKWACK